MPDPQVQQEFGDVTSMTLYRWTRDPALGFPQPIKIRGRIFRSRRQLEAFKRRMVEQAVRERARRHVGGGDDA